MKRFANILLIVDVSTDCQAALKRAATLASNNQANLTVCTVVDEIPPEMQIAVTAVTPAELAEIVVAERHDLLKDIVEATEDDGLSVSIRVRMGKPFLEIIRQVLECDHDLIIKTAECDVGLKATLFGSTDMHLMRKCPCPVWIIKPTDEPRYHRILAAVDQDPAGAVTDSLNRQILEMATSLALAEFSELHIVHAWNLISEYYLRSMRSGYSNAEVEAIVAEEIGRRKKWLESLVQAYAANADEGVIDYVMPQLHVIKGAAKYIIPATARDLNVDLIIMGTVARSGISGLFMGNTAESILNQIDCSVLTVKPPGFVSPVVA
jgi:nucleotide-binding universal stress UspA family protein